VQGPTLSHFLVIIKKKKTNKQEHTAIVNVIKKKLRNRSVKLGSVFMTLHLSG
jgi:hypothetical protein